MQRILLFLASACSVLCAEPTILNEEQLLARREQGDRLRNNIWAEAGKQKSPSARPVDRGSLDVLKDILGPRTVPTAAPKVQDLGAFKLLGSGNHPPSKDHWIAALPADVDSGEQGSAHWQTLNNIFGHGTPNHPYAPPSDRFSLPSPKTSPMEDIPHDFSPVVLHAPPAEPPINEIPHLFTAEVRSPLMQSSLEYPAVAYPGGSDPALSDSGLVSDEHPEVLITREDNPNSAQGVAFLSPADLVKGMKHHKPAKLSLSPDFFEEAMQQGPTTPVFAFFGEAKHQKESSKTALPMDSVSTRFEEVKRQKEGQHIEESTKSPLPVDSDPIGFDLVSDLLDEAKHQENFVSSIGEPGNIKTPRARSEAKLGVTENSIDSDRIGLDFASDLLNEAKHQENSRSSIGEPGSIKTPRAHSEAKLGVTENSVDSDPIRLDLVSDLLDEAKHQENSGSSIGEPGSIKTARARSVVKLGITENLESLAALRRKTHALKQPSLSA